MTEKLNVVGLLSGGKDSCYNLCHCAALGHNIVALATLAPPEGKGKLTESNTNTKEPSIVIDPLFSHR